MADQDKKDAAKVKEPMEVYVERKVQLTALGYKQYTATADQAGFSTDGGFVFFAAPGKTAGSINIRIPGLLGKGNSDIGYNFDAVINAMLPTIRSQAAKDNAILGIKTKEKTTAGRGRTRGEKLADDE